ncbi:hypothetical protein ACU4GD_27450 [Cupriavidus basilensis]
MGQGIHTALSMLGWPKSSDIPAGLAREYQGAPVAAHLHGNVVAMGDSSLPLHSDGARQDLGRALHWIMAKSAREIGLIITGGGSSAPMAGSTVREAAATLPMRRAGGGGWRVGGPSQQRKSASAKASLIGREAAEADPRLAAWPSRRAVFLRRPLSALKPARIYQLIGKLRRRA